MGSTGGSKGDDWRVCKWGDLGVCKGVHHQLHDALHHTCHYWLQPVTSLLQIWLRICLRMNAQLEDIELSSSGYSEGVGGARGGWCGGGDLLQVVLVFV